MASLISIVISLLILGLIYWIITLLPVPAVVKQVALVILAIIAVVYLFGILTGSPSFPRLTL